MTLFRELDIDWAATIARAPQVPKHWPPPLRRAPSLGQLIRDVRHAAHPTSADRLLWALVALAPTDDLAARTILQALLPGLRRIAVSNQWRGDPADIDAETIAAAWANIRTYPLARRPRRIAANIVLDTAKAVAKAHRCAPQTSAPTTLEEEATGDAITTVIDRHCVTSAFRRAHAKGTVSHYMTNVIVRSRMLGEPLDDIAAETGISGNALRKRRLRAEARLAEAVRETRHRSDNDGSLTSRGR